MAGNGQDFACVRCHSTNAHHIAGRVYTAKASPQRKSLLEDDLTSKITCESCHSIKPHQSSSKANDHTDKVACQSCHIPTFARQNPTKISWDWSQAGKLKDGKPFKTTDALGKHDYMSIKGQMIWRKNVRPTYFWYDGSIKSLTDKDIIDPAKPVAVSFPVGRVNDPDSRIAPFKIHRSIQPYDKVHKTLLTPLLSGDEGYWTTFDWQSAFEKGMAYSGMPYSGEYDFVSTTYVFPITHMVAPKKDVVKCSECHTRENSRLSNITGVYLPGRDRSSIVDTMGWALVLISFTAICFHGLGRFMSQAFKKKTSSKEER